MQKNSASVEFNYQANPLQRAFERKQSRFRRTVRRMRNIVTRDHLILDLGSEGEVPATIFLSSPWQNGRTLVAGAHRRYDVSTIGNYCWLTTGRSVISATSFETFGSIGRSRATISARRTCQIYIVSTVNRSVQGAGEINFQWYSITGFYWHTIADRNYRSYRITVLEIKLIIASKNL